MGKEPFFERFKRLVPAKDFAVVEVATGMSRDKLRRLSNGTTASIDLLDGLRVARFLEISPWDLAGEPDPYATAVTRAESNEVVLRDADVDLGHPDTLDSLPTPQANAGETAARSLEDVLLEKIENLERAAEDTRARLATLESRVPPARNRARKVAS